MITELIIHIGLPKTATTTIQDHVLKGNTGYLGKTSNADSTSEKETKKLFKEFKEISRLPFRRNNISPSAVVRGKKLIKNCYDMWPDLNRLSISDEFFSTRRIGGGAQSIPIGQRTSNDYEHSRPIIKFLQGLNDQVLIEGQIKVVLVLRNQPDWLASLYAQRSSEIPSASQAHFEHEIDCLIKNSDDYIDWSKWVGELSSAFGRQNVCVLLMEEMNSVHFWKQLVEFMQISDINIDRMINRNEAKENVRRVTKDSWEIVSPAGNLRSVKRIVNQYWSRNRFPKLRKITREMGRFYNRVLTGLDSDYGSTVEMNADLRDKILEYCRPANARLAQQLNRDNLKTLGY